MIVIPSEILNASIPSLGKDDAYKERQPPLKKRKLANGQSIESMMKEEPPVIPKAEHQDNEDEDGDGDDSQRPAGQPREPCFEDHLLEPLIVRIGFTVKEPIDGIHWIVPRDNKDGTPSMSISPSAPTPSSSNLHSRASSVPLPSSNGSRRTWGEMEHVDHEVDHKKSEVMFADRKSRMFSL